MKALLALVVLLGAFACQAATDDARNVQAKAAFD
jgi:hypothetical protein